MMCARCKEPFLTLKAFDEHLDGTPSKRKPCRPPATLGMTQIRGQWAQTPNQKD